MIIKLITILVAFSFIADASSEGIRANTYKENKTIIYTETIEAENHIYALALKKEEAWPPILTDEGAVKINSDIFSEYRESRFYMENTCALLDNRKGKDPTPAQFAEAGKKDQAHKDKVKQALEAECKRAKLKYDPKTESIVYFYSGKAKMRVIESLQGNLKKGDTIQVTWHHVLDKVSCPTIMPYLGKFGWIFKDDVKSGGAIELGHAFRSLEVGRKAKLAFEKKGE